MSRLRSGSTTDTNGAKRPERAINSRCSDLNKGMGVRSHQPSQSPRVINQSHLPHSASSSTVSEDGLLRPAAVRINGTIMMRECVHPKQLLPLPTSTAPARPYQPFTGQSNKAGVPKITISPLCCCFFRLTTPPATSYRPPVVSTPVLKLVQNCGRKRDHSDTVVSKQVQSLHSFRSRFSRGH